MKMYNVWLCLILLAILTGNNKLQELTAATRRNNQLLEQQLRQQLAARPSSSVPASLRAWLHHRPGTPVSMAESLLDYYRRYRPDLLPSDAR